MKSVLKIALAILILLWSPVSLSSASTPAEQIQETVEHVRAVLRHPMSKGEARKAERREKLREAIFPRFDFPEMARRSLGQNWRSLNGREDEFVSAFTGFVENSYVTQVESFKDEKVSFVRERVDRDFAEVDTKVIQDKGEPIAVNYKLHRVGGEWKIYDVVIENISMVNNYRSQFSRILASGSFDELLKRLREKGSERRS